MVKVRVFLLGVLLVSKHLNCSDKERLFSLPSELLLTADERRNTVLHMLVFFFDHGPRLADAHSAALETSVRYEHKHRFSG